MTAQQICVFGNTACAWDIAARLRRAGLSVALAASGEARTPRETGRLDPGTPPIETLFGVQLASCRGGPGHFDLIFSGKNTTKKLTAAALVVAGAAVASALVVRRHIDRLDLVAVMKTRE